jgi:anti-sigma factor (TIGR02949 family)
MGEKCTDILRWKDSFTSGELPAAEIHRIQEHLEACPDCAAQFEQVQRLRAHLKSAVAAQASPIGLETRIRARLREPGRKTLDLPLPKLAFAALGVVILTVGAWSLALRPMRHQIASMLGIGAGDHIHCTLERQNPPQGTAFNGTDADFPGLQAAVRENLPKEFRLFESHMCRHKGRRFGHFVFEKQGHKVSVLATRKLDSEHFPRTALLARMRAHGIPVYHDALPTDALPAGSVQASGFETARYFVFVVSDLPERENLAVMAALGPVLTEVVR